MVNLSPQAPIATATFPENLANMYIYVFAWLQLQVAKIFLDGGGRGGKEGGDFLSPPSFA